MILDNLQSSFFYCENLLLKSVFKRPPCLLALCLCYECCLAAYNKTDFTFFFLSFGCISPFFPSLSFLCAVPQ